MCKTCGCAEGQKEFWANSKEAQTQLTQKKHTHLHPHEHEHVHPMVKSDKSILKKITLHSNILDNNDQLAAQNRQYFTENNILTLNLMSSPGTGKTSLLTQTLLELKKSNIEVASFVGDQTTDIDAHRLQTSGTWVHQINTFSSCHLDAKHIQKVIPLLPEIPQILFIENVGNLVCPAAFDLGEQIKVALISCTEGEDKVLKYPVLFHLAQVVVLTKVDLIPHLRWDTALFKKNLKKINPLAQLFEVSSQTGEGMNQWVEFIKKLLN
jgi:hydrogenase nickel incorporation protein HypB